MLIANGLSVEVLSKEYRITNRNPFKDNGFLMCSDDCGSPCLTKREYTCFIGRINDLPIPKNDRKFLLLYLDSRVRCYRSPRRGDCVSLRGIAYYQTFLEHNQDVLIVNLKQNLRLDVKVFNLMSRLNLAFPKELLFMVIEHVKNTLFQIMSVYVEKSIREPAFFNDHDWFALDDIARALWDIFVRVILIKNYRLKTGISFESMFRILSHIREEPINPLRELDSAKTLIRFCNVVYEKDESFDFCMPLLNGGIEIPYALYGYNLFKKSSKFNKIIPAVFSFNRMRKGKISREVLSSDGLLDMSKMQHIIPSYFLDNLKNSSRILVVDNNITTGYSTRILRDSFKRYGHTCEIAVAEINLHEIRGICENRTGFENKSVLMRGSDLFCPPVGEYVTCFGIKDNSKVVNRIRFLTNSGEYMQIEGYDFDDTLAKTGMVHRKSWNHALEKLGYSIDVIEIPTNSGLTFKTAAENIYQYLSDKGIPIGTEKAAFVKAMCFEKKEAMMRCDQNDIVLIAKTLNIIRADTANTKIIVSNNDIDFILHCLAQKDILKYFSYIFCPDCAYCVGSKEKVAIQGNPKPSIEGFMEALTYFQLPMLQKFYGDHKVIDRQFAEKLECEFVLI